MVKYKHNFYTFKFFGMPTKSTTSTKKKITTKTANQTTNKKISWKTKDDKMLERVEKYVDKNREKTSQEIIERKSKRPAKNFQEWDLEVMISRVNIESKPREKTKEISKRIIYMIYAIIFVIMVIFIAKFFFAWNVPQIS